VLRCWSPDDAALLNSAIEASLAHLRPWMPWAEQEPEGLHRKAQRLRRFRARFEQGEDLIWGIFTIDETQVLGGVGLHHRIGAGAWEVGRWAWARRRRRP
jgi:RimJ/RimL family protein N-acetyltransferase